MSSTGKVKSTRVLPSISPSRWKYPTPLLKRTTWEIGSSAAGGFRAGPPLGPCCAGDEAGHRANAAAASPAAATDAATIVRRMTFLRRNRVRDARCDAMAPIIDDAHALSVGSAWVEEWF